VFGDDYGMTSTIDIRLYGTKNTTCLFTSKVWGSVGCGEIFQLLFHELLVQLVALLFSVRSLWRVAWRLFDFVSLGRAMGFCLGVSSKAFGWAVQTSSGLL